MWGEGRREGGELKSVEREKRKEEREEEGERYGGEGRQLVCMWEYMCVGENSACIRGEWSLYVLAPRVRVVKPRLCIKTMRARTRVVIGIRQLF